MGTLVLVPTLLLQVKARVMGGVWGEIDVGGKEGVSMDKRMRPLTIAIDA